MDNFIIDHAFKHKLKILDLTYVNKVYHKNHEQFKISGYFNLILKPNDQTEFQNSRRTYSFINMDLFGFLIRYFYLIIKY